LVPQQSSAIAPGAPACRRHPPVASRVFWPTIAPITCDSALCSMYFGSVAWTLCYDTIYAHQDKFDDVRIGVRSTALLLGDWTKPACATWSALFIGGLVLSGADVGWPLDTFSALCYRHSVLAASPTRVCIRTALVCHACITVDSGTLLAWFLCRAWCTVLRVTARGFSPPWVAGQHPYPLLPAPLFSHFRMRLHAIRVSVWF
jgi:hypothetical protein